MIDLKTALIMAGAVFLIWSCSGVQAQEPAASMSTVVDKDACYQSVNAQVRGVWAALDMGTRAGLAMEAIALCEGGGQ